MTWFLVFLFVFVFFKCGFVRNFSIVSALPTVDSVCVVSVEKQTAVFYLLTLSEKHDLAHSKDKPEKTNNICISVCYSENALTMSSDCPLSWHYIVSAVELAELVLKVF